ncbi:hypothetical protein [Halovenus marina]|uniref:hypothetical protein n=1 Tax=Halovenus marina TaxID=3396621 RepID=UPI003F5546CE
MNVPSTDEVPLPPHVIAMLGILATVPITAYASATGYILEVSLILTFVNVFLITSSLVFLFGPDEDPSPGEVASLDEV